MREKKPQAVIQDTMRKAENIADSFQLFTNNCRVMFLMQRSKEGGKTNNTKVRKIITNNSTEFVQALYDMLIIKDASDQPLRIYSSINARNVRKAVKEFKLEQIEMEWQGDTIEHAFYMDIKNRWIHALMVPRNALESYFILDLDTPEEHNDALKALAMAGLNPKIQYQYPTKNGWHIITNPFNPALIGSLAEKIHKDGLILLSY